MTEWQPIETAPKDGRPVLIWSPSTHTYVCVARFWEYAGAWSDEQDDTAKPTHWQPLPAPPSQEDKTL